MMRFLILLATICLFPVTDGAETATEFQIEFEANSQCDAGDPPIQQKLDNNGKPAIFNKKYRVVAAYIFWTNSNGKILGRALCNIPSSNCDGEQVNPVGAAKTYLAISVTLQKSSFEDQNIHYQYHDDIFELSKIEDPSTHPASSDIHKLSNFLFPKSAKYKKGTKTLTFNGGNCRKNRAKSLISGHGYFITEFKDNSNGAASWENLYYLPYRIGQYVTTPN